MAVTLLLLRSIWGEAWSLIAGDPLSYRASARTPIWPVCLLVTPGSTSDTCNSLALVLKWSEILWYHSSLENARLILLNHPTRFKAVGSSRAYLDFFFKHGAFFQIIVPQNIFREILPSVIFSS